MVGLQGFEPWTSCTRDRRSTKLSHSPNPFSRGAVAALATPLFCVLRPRWQASKTVIPARTAAPGDARFRELTNRLTAPYTARKVPIRLSPLMLASKIIPPVIAGSSPTILQFPADTTRVVRSLRNMTSQLLQEAAQVIPNQQLLINVVSRRVRQLGLGHRPLVEATPRSSLTDIALREIIDGKLTFELTPETNPADGA